MIGDVEVFILQGSEFGIVKQQVGIFVSFEFTVVEAIVGADLGIRYELELLSDANAAMGISRRLGIGKIRHLDTSLLWIQQKIREKDIALTKVLGRENPGDSFTKYLSGPEIKSHLVRMGLELQDGRAASAPTLT